MDLAQLRTVICVAEVGSLSRAADILCSAQPALSRHVRLLEEELGVRLFDRHGRGMLITEHGRLVVEHARRIMGELDGIVSGLADENGSMRGHISIGMTPTLAEVLTAPLIAALQTAHPLSTCRVVSAFSYYLLDWTHRGEIDIALLYDPHSIKSLKAEFLVEEELFAVAPAGSGLSKDQPINIRRLSQVPLILPSNRHSLRNIVDRAALEKGVVLQCPIEADSYSMLRALVRGGSGWTVLPTAAIAEDLERGALCSAPFTTPIKRRIEMCYSPERPLSQMGLLALSKISQTTIDLVKSGRWINAKLIR